jgi:hypothetical protein
MESRVSCSGVLRDLHGVQDTFVFGPQPISEKERHAS